jgi:hypothetical protein
VRPALREALARFGDDQPWESTLTMHHLATSSLGLTEALEWGRQSVALFRKFGDQQYAANTLFIMAQRSMDAGVADDEVSEWLTESLALAEAAASQHDQVHATVGLAQLAWLRGDHDRAAELMEECLPTLRRLGDLRCSGRALHLLGERAHEQQELTRAEELLRASIEEIALAGQLFILVGALETLATVLSAQGRPWPAAVLLGTAHAARESAGAHMRPIQPPDIELRQSLIQDLGTSTFDTAHGEGERLSATQALKLASPEITARPASP